MINIEQDIIKKELEERLNNNIDPTNMVESIVNKCLDNITQSDIINDVILINQYGIRERIVLELAKKYLETYDRIFIVFNSILLIEQIEDTAKELKIETSKDITSKGIKFISNVKFIKQFKNISDKKSLFIDINANKNPSKKNLMLSSKGIDVIRFMGTYEYEKIIKEFRVASRKLRRFE